MKYRVLMQDSVNGQSFHFAMHYDAAGMIGAASQAGEEFSDATVVEVRQVEPAVTL